MKNPISTWDAKLSRKWRKKSVCVNTPIQHTFTVLEKDQAIKKLEALFPKSKVYPTFAERMLILSEIY